MNKLIENPSASKEPSVVAHTHKEFNYHEIALHFLTVGIVNNEDQVGFGFNVLNLSCETNTVVQL